jgi:hypothetical protein
VQWHTVEQFGPQQGKTPEGFLIVRDVVIARTGQRATCSARGATAGPLPFAERSGPRWSALGQGNDEGAEALVSHAFRITQLV